MMIRYNIYVPRKLRIPLYRFLDLLLTNKNYMINKNYYDQDLIDKVYERYKKDFKIFGYKKVVV